MWEVPLQQENCLMRRILIAGEKIKYIIPIDIIGKLEYDVPIVLKDIIRGGGHYEKV